MDRPATTLWAALLLAAVAGTATFSGASDKLILTGQLGMVPWKTKASLETMAARAAFDKFAAAHPEVEVQEFERIWLPGSHWGAAQIMSLAAGAGPDMLYLPFGELGKYVREGLIQPVDAAYEDWDEKGRWPSTLTEPLKLESHTWGAVSSAHYALLAGQREVFTAAGLDERALPKT